MNDKGEKLLLPLTHRFSVEYMKKIRSRMSSLKKRHNESSAVMLTLTLNPALYKNKLEMWLSIKDDLHRFMMLFKYHFKKEKRDFPPYLSAIHSQKNGNPHIHIVFLNATRLMDWHKIEKFWGKGYVWINRTQGGGKIRHPVSYITKYITRTFTKVKENSLTQAMVWFFACRSYSYSRGLVLPLSGNGSEWIAVCFVVASSYVESDVIQLKVERYVNEYLNYCVPP